MEVNSQDDKATTSMELVLFLSSESDADISTLYHTFIASDSCGP